jgi:hypothetical protein
MQSVTLLDGRIQALGSHLREEDNPERTLNWEIRVLKDQLPELEKLESLYICR